ncbi:MAG: hypothetical protein WCQ47_07930 [bacterium]
MFLEQFYRTGKNVLIFIPVLFVLCSCSTFNPKINRAIARRSLDAASAAGATSSKCASKDFYDAERSLKMGERFLMDRKTSESSDEYFIKATSLAEKAEQEATFCEK